MKVLRQQFQITFLLTVSLTIFSVAARTFGAGQAPHPMLRGFSVGCDEHAQPCWYGIIPGETNAAQAQLQYARYGVGPTSDSNDDYLALLSPYCLVRLYYDSWGVNPTVEYIGFINCQDIQLGHVMGIFGTPDALNLTDERIYYRSTFSASVKVGLPPKPLTAVEQIFVPLPAGVTTFTAWRGFVPRWRYYQLEPDKSR